jgi:hypothetical protein
MGALHMLTLMAQFYMTIGYDISYKTVNTIIELDDIYDNTAQVVISFIIFYFSVSILIALMMSKTIYGNSTSMYLMEDDVNASNDDDDDDDDDELDNDSDDDDNDDDNDDDDYINRHFDTLEGLSDNVLSSDQLRELISEQYVSEETPKGIVVLSYNIGTDSFEYYTDKCSDISYEILDSVARFFTVKLNCKQICVNYKAEIENGTNKMLSDIEYDKLIKENKEKMMQEREEGSVFASFKSYNKKSGNNVDKKYYVITDKANRFKYKGKIIDYEKIRDAAKEKKETCKNISYCDYKRSVSDDKRSVSDDKRSVSDDKRSVSDDKRSVSDDKRSVSDDKRSVSDDKRSVSDDKRSVSD